MEDERAARWVWWCRTRHYFAPRVKSNILARLRPGGRNFEPDAFLDKEMPFFNMAVHALCESALYEKEATCFVGMYWYDVNIKAFAKEQECARGTIYNRARRFARHAYALSQSIAKIHGTHGPETCSILVEQNSSLHD